MKYKFEGEAEQGDTLTTLDVDEVVDIAEDLAKDWMCNVVYYDTSTPTDTYTAVYMGRCECGNDTLDGRSYCSECHHDMLIDEAYGAEYK